MDLFDELKSLGVEVEEGMDRMMGNASLYQRLLGKLRDLVMDFSSDIDFDCEDNSDMIEKVHAIKGAAGNLSVVPLYRAYSEILLLLREGKREQAGNAYRDILPVQQKILECIGSHIK